MNPRAHAAAPTDRSATARSDEPTLGSPDDLVWHAQSDGEAHGTGPSGLVLAPPPVDATPAPLAPPTDTSSRRSSGRRLGRRSARRPHRDPADPVRPAGADDVDDLKEFAAAVEAGRRDAHRLRWLVGGLVSAIVFAALVYGGVSLAERRDRPPEPTVPDATALADPATIEAAASLSTELDGAAGDLSSMSFRWSDPSGQRLAVDVDATAGTFEITTDDGVELRFDGDTYEGRATNGSADAAWQEISGDPFARRPIIGLDGLPTVVDVIPAAVREYSIAEVSDGSTTIVVIDDDALATADPNARADWLATWGLSSSSGTTDQIEVLVTTTSGGIVTLAALVEPTLGGGASFELVSFELVDP